MGGVVSGIGSLVGGIIQAEGAKSAAKTQAGAITDATKTSRQAAEQARNEILDRMNPALAQYRYEMADSLDTVMSGESSIMDILQKATGQANNMLSQAGADAMRAIMGSTASAQGVPRNQFEQTYSQGGPEAVQNMTMQPGIPGGSRATRLREQTEQDRIMAERAPTFEPGMKQLLDEQDQPVMTSGLVGGIGGASYQIPTMTELTPEEQLETWKADRQQRALEAGRAYTPPETGGVRQFGDMEVRQPAGQTVGADRMPSAGGDGQIGFAGATAARQQGLQGGLGALAQGTGVARGDIQAGRESALGALGQAETRGLERYQPYSQAGRAAIGQEAALSGAMGPEAQQQAIDAFIESPGQKYLREQQEKSLLRSASATGGLGGSRVLTALQEQAMGRAAGQQQQQLENLRSIAGRGQQVAGAEAGLISGTGSQQAQVHQQASQQLAGLAQQLGMSQADLMRMSASEQAALAERTGLNIANIQQTIQAAQAGNVLNLGGQMAGIRGGTLADVANIQQQIASGELSGQQNIAQILANLATQSGTNISNLQVAGGAAQAAGAASAAQSYGQTAQNLGQIAAYSLANRDQPQQTTYTGGQTAVPATNRNTPYF